MATSLARVDLSAIGRVPTLQLDLKLFNRTAILCRVQMWLPRSRVSLTAMLSLSSQGQRHNSVLERCRHQTERLTTVNTTWPVIRILMATSLIQEAALAGALRWARKVLAVPETIKALTASASTRAILQIVSRAQMPTPSLQRRKRKRRERSQLSGRRRRPRDKMKRAPRLKR